MIVLVFYQRKGRVSARFYPFYETSSSRFPEIDNTTAPIALSFIHKIFTVLQDEFWSSKIGILCYLFMVFFVLEKEIFIESL